MNETKRLDLPHFDGAGNAHTVTVAELRKRSLFIALPMYGGKSDFNFFMGMQRVAREFSRMGINFHVEPLANESLIPRARNYLADKFMRSGFTHMLFIDGDIGFSESDIVWLLSWASPQSEYDVVTGAYPKKCITWEKIVNVVNKGVADKDPNILERFTGDFVLNGVPGGTEINPVKPLPITEAGTGFMLMQRHVFERIQEKFPAYWYKPDHSRNVGEFDGSRKIMQYFHCEIDTGFTLQDMLVLLKKMDANSSDAKELAKNMLEAYKKASLRYLSEDYWFCRRAAESGSKVWVLPHLNLTHAGQYVYNANLLDTLKYGCSPTHGVNQKITPRKNSGSEKREPPKPSKVIKRKL